ncbi:SipW-dependent-type signal peptide-containing protein [Salinirubrum litoreum]|uniref:SipW-dependent-type signal peptide-containing protein n=1 Tax=Salinirubrum litoreum TaxID=1126234 RepID=A0ABD5R8U8_9EURY|nr:SipW-dependent-type signal peptide-containing protein [Salinirubrum litoreum]
MTDRRIRLTRRRVLTVLGTVGVSAAGAGLGTVAYLTDSEEFTDNAVQAGDLNLAVTFDGAVSQDGADTDSSVKTNVTVDGASVSGAYVVEDLKPGDSGHFEFVPSVEGNPAYVFAGGTLVANDENSVTEPEADADGEDDDYAPDDDIDGGGELAQHVEITAVQGFVDSVETPLSLYDLLTTAMPTADGGRLVTDCDPDGDDEYTEDDEQAIRVEWRLPNDVGNEVQTDSVDFSFEVGALQSRHTDGERVESPIGAESGGR